MPKASHTPGNSRHGTPMILCTPLPARLSMSRCSRVAPNHVASRAEAAASMTGVASMERAQASALSTLVPSGAYDCSSTGLAEPLLPG
eukprot:scaffold26606_cov124-Isochrysis_galbana.AAC.5